MHIALLFEFGTLNGGEHSMLAVMDRLRESECQFTAMAPPASDLSRALESRGVSVIPYSVRDAAGKRRPRPETLSDLQKLIADLSCDLVHANSLSMGRLTGLLTENLSVPCSAHLRDILKLNRTTIRDLNRNRQLVAVSDATRDFHIAQGGEPNRILTVYNGVDTERFQPRPRSEPIREELGVREDEILILNVGQIGLRKGQNVLADAALTLAPHWPNLHYAFAGQRCSEKQESRDFERGLITRFQSLANGRNVHWLGYRDDMPNLMNAADLLVHTAHQEPLGRVLLEAAASGLPIIATDVGGTSEILQHNHSAHLLPPGHPDELAEATHQFLRSPQTFQQYAMNARGTIEAKFSIDQAATNLHAVWSDLC